MKSDGRSRMVTTVMGYIGPCDLDTPRQDELHVARPLRDFHSVLIGTCRFTSKWRSPLGGEWIYAVRAKVDGREYFGVSRGSGMSVALRETAASRRNSQCQSK